MTSAELAKAEATLRLMVCGRTEEAREKLAGMVLDAGGTVPSLPVITKVGPPVASAVPA